MNIPSKTKLMAVLGLVLLASGAVTGVFLYKREFPSPAQQASQQENADNPQQTQSGQNGISAQQNTTGMPLKLPDGFAIETYAEGVRDARAMVLDGRGNMLVSQPDAGTISRIETKNGKADKVEVLLRGLDTPHGLAVDPQDYNILYFAERDKISKVRLYSDEKPQKIADLPGGSVRHVTRTLVFGNDNRLYVSIGSSCDVCYESDNRRAAIYSMDKDGSDFRLYAKGLRNAVFFAFSYIDGRMWTTEMGRDNLGNDVPPDEINIVKQDGDYGWPICYGKNIHDDNFDKNRYVQDPCRGKEPSHIDLPAHSAPLGLAFVPEEGWPEDYWYHLIVALHGSWNRTEPAGYKLVRVKLSDKGEYLGIEDFITGFLPQGARSGNEALGRPAGLLIQPGGILYVSDDKAGKIYKVSYLRNLANSTSDAVSLSNLKENQEVKSPLDIEGEAVGNWFFEASFPVTLVDANWKQVAQGIAQAQGEWMTTEKVRFKARLGFSAPETETGWLVLKKDNPSGLPEHDAEVHFPVRFAPNASSGLPKDPISATPVSCKVSGCSGQICSEQTVPSNCEYKAEYGCYKTAKCERQPGGQCGWTQTKELQNCLASNQ